MKQAELRIGNYVSYKDKAETIVSIVMSIANMGTYLGGIGVNDDRKTVKYEDCSPIPLDEDWLERFDFIKENGNWHKGYLVVSKEDGGFYFSGMRDGIVDLTYVHKLQNLYYAINEVDLIITQ